LDAARVAGLMGISTRQLHMIFEPSGVSVARMIKTARLAEAFRLITTQPERRLTEIAFACGFDSLATFY
ncbi:helix-turn-helix domain-containing protein, partial [Escherichia coli]|uniref:helix-turn-helix domain-containing protein n=1 Tax=Escherichia coli TaxID=562 RepID=UPI0013D56726